MIRSVKGTYNHGRVVLDEEVPASIEHAEVIVVFVDESPRKQLIQKGMLRPADGAYTSEEDFRDAKAAIEPKELRG